MEWKEFNNYKVSDNGQVMNSRGKLMKLQYDKDGYLKVTLHIDKKAKCFRVHRLVAQLFIPNPDNLPTVNHINEIRDDNRASNLEWMTIKDNVIYSQGEAVQQFTKNGELINEYISLREAERQTGIGHKEISNCCKHKVGYKTAGGFKWSYKNE